jgi:hypothetical protein
MDSINEQIQAKNKEIYQNKITIDTNKNIESFNLTVANLIDIIVFKKKNISKEIIKEYKDEVKKILVTRSQTLLENISNLNDCDKKIEELVDKTSEKFFQDIKNLKFEEKIIKDINDKIIAEEKNKSQSLKNSYIETKKYINNVENLSLSIEKPKVKIFQKEA